jgi:hypothetical protein
MLILAILILIFIIFVYILFYRNSYQSECRVEPNDNYDYPTDNFTPAVSTLNKSYDQTLDIVNKVLSSDSKSREYKPNYKGNLYQLCPCKYKYVCDTVDTNFLYS